MSKKSVIGSLNGVLKHKDCSFNLEPITEDIIGNMESSYCGLNCKACKSYLSNECQGCTYTSKKTDCPIYLCATEKGYISCLQCLEKDICEIGKTRVQKCEKNIIVGPLFEEGACYLINEVSLSIAYNIFELQVSQNKPCLCITKEMPDEIREEHAIIKSPFICLTNDTVKGEVCIKPNDYEELFNTVNNYIKKDPTGAIILNNFDILLENAHSMHEKNSLLVYIQHIFNSVKNSRVTLFIVSGKDSRFIKEGSWAKLPNPSYIEWLRPLHIELICAEVISCLSKDDNDRLQLFKKLRSVDSDKLEFTIENDIIKCTHKIIPSRSEVIEEIKKCHVHLGIPDSDENIRSILCTNLLAFGYSPYEYIFDYKDSYMLIDIDMSDAFDIFKDTVEHGKYGLCLTRMLPDNLIVQFSQHNVSILQLTQITGKNHLSPTSLSLIQNAILSYIKEHNGCVVFFDGLEYLVAHNGFTKTLQFIQAIKDYAQSEKSLLLIPLFRQAFTDQEFAFLEREFKRFESIEFKEKKKFIDVLSSVME
ncbi:MAG: DUF835 domain-containing protein [Methanosarcinaceae archaeon]|nr:DUF835 domain-containing protein [Methanosarcinaceae archaeon]